MSEWITHRRPINDDEEYVFNGFGDVVHYLDIKQGEPWMRIERPEPYVKPKRWQVNYSHTSENWYIWNNEKQVVQLYYLQDFYKHHEAAERIAAIYEEVMP